MTSDLQCNLEIALWANHIQVLNEEKSGLSITEEMVMKEIPNIYAKVKIFHLCREKSLIPTGVVIRSLHWRGGMSWWPAYVLKCLDSTLSSSAFV